MEPTRPPAGSSASSRATRGWGSRATRTPGTRAPSRSHTTRAFLFRACRHETSVGEALDDPSRLSRRGDGMQALRLVAVDSPTDEDGIKELARIDREAASEALIRRWREPLSRHAASIVKDAQEAMDVAHEVLVRAMREP